MAGIELRGKCSMSGIIHRYVRRAVLWAQTPSDEELARREAAAKASRRQRLARNVRNALLTDKHYAEWQGLNAEDAANLIHDVRLIGLSDPMISGEAIDRLVRYLEMCLPARSPNSNDEAEG